MTTTQHEAAERVSAMEEAIRLAEVGEYLYNSCTYSYGDGRTEPREYGIEWQWQQSKPGEYGQGQLLAAATKWHEEQAADGIITEASKLRAALRAHDAEKSGMSRATSDVLAERQRQLDVEGWTLAHDDAHDAGQMAKAAACYALGSDEISSKVRGPVHAHYVVMRLWPWAREWWKPTTPRRMLVKAAALIIAEIERLDRAEGRTPTETKGGASDE